MFLREALTALYPNALSAFFSLCNNSCFPLAEGKLLYQLYFLLVQYLCVTRSYFAPTEKWGIHSQLLVDTKRSKKEPQKGLRLLRKDLDTSYFPCFISQGKKYQLKGFSLFASALQWQKAKNKIREGCELSFYTQLFLPS